MADPEQSNSHNSLISSQPLPLILQEYESHPSLNKSLVGKKFDLVRRVGEGQGSYGDDRKRLASTKVNGHFLNCLVIGKELAG